MEKFFTTTDSNHQINLTDSSSLSNHSLNSASSATVTINLGNTNSNSTSNASGNKQPQPLLINGHTTNVATTPSATMPAQEPNQNTVISDTNAQALVIMSAINKNSSSNDYDNLNLTSEAPHAYMSSLHGNNAKTAARTSTEVTSVFGQSKSMQEASKNNLNSLISLPSPIANDGAASLAKKINQPQPSNYYSDKQDHIELNKKLALIPIQGNLCISN